MSEPEYLTVSQYAALIGVSEKTARKRISRGDVKAERVALPGGGWAWHVYPERLEAVGNRLEVQNESESVPTNERLESVTVAVGTLPTAKVPTVPTDAMAERLAQSREEILFLRGLIEQRDRDAAELRAALRKALEAMPKALQEGSTPNAENIGRENALQAKIIAVGDVAPVAQKQSVSRGTKPRKLTAWQRIGGRILGIR
jgi:hypothetical protein